VAAEAEEVVVVTAMSLGCPVADPTAATAAPQCSLQVVSVVPGPISGDAPRAEDVLNSLPQDIVDERFMVAVVNDAVEQQLALVVRVTEDSVKLAGVASRVTSTPDGVTRRDIANGTIFIAGTEPGPESCALAAALAKQLIR
jgi:hypothetical protein